MTLIVVHGGQGEPTVPHHRGGDPVIAGAFSQRVPCDLCIHVGVHVDEPRADDLALCVDNSIRSATAQVSDLGDDPIVDGDVGPVPGATRTVHYLAPADDHVHHRRPP